jgi:integrase
MKKIQDPKFNNRRERHLTNEEFIFLVTGNYHQIRLRNIIEVALETGMRRGEILKIKSEHFKGEILLIPETKNGYSRTIPLPNRALYILKKSDLSFTMTVNALR